MAQNKPKPHESTATRWSTARERRRRLLAEWRQSGQSAAEFCRRRELAYTTFCGWRQRAARESAAAPGSAVAAPRAKRKTSGCGNARSSPPGAPVFVPLGWSGPAASPPVEIILRNGRTLRVPWACEPETAARWAAALEAAQPC